MENFESLPIEKEKGRDVKINAVFIRHAEKETLVGNPETALTKRGKERSIEYGKSLSIKDAIKAYSSDTERTKETADLIVGSSGTEKKMTRRIKEGLAFHYDKEGDFTKEFTEMKAGLLGNDFDQVPEDERERRLQEMEDVLTDYYLGFGDRRPDPKTYSPVETAALLAKRVDIYLRMADRLKSGSDIDLINTTHDLNLLAFLKEVLIRKVGGKEVKGFESVKEIGGATRYNEGFEVLIANDEQGAKSLKLKFRGQDYDIDTGRLEELVQIADDLERQRE